MNINEIIISKDNRLIKLYRQVSIAKQDGLFVLEGMRIVSDALESDAPLTHILITEQAHAKKPLCDPRVTVISDALGEKIAATKGTQGVFAIAEKPAPLNVGSINRGRYIVLCGLQDPGNVGTIIRTADALGLNGVFLAGSCSPFNPKAVRSAMGSVFRVPLCETLDIAEILALGISSYAAVVSGGEELGTLSFNDPCMVVIGGEGNGLDEDTVNKCTKKVTVKMTGGAESLNAAVTSAIFMWELQKIKA